MAQSLFTTLGEYENTITLPANSTNQLIQSFNNDTSVVMTIYIENPLEIPLGATQNVTMQVQSWQNGLNAVMTLDQYNYGKYFENYPIGSFYLQNNFNVPITIYIQYIIKSYYEYFSPLVQDLTELTLTQRTLTGCLTAGTNFRYYGGISGFSGTNIPLDAIIYVLDQQVSGTSGSAAGSVTVPWTASYSEHLTTPALGAAEDNSDYIFQVDSTTQALPGNVTSSNATMNWAEVDFWSPITISNTVGSEAITYNTTNNDWECSTTFSYSAYSTYMTSLPAKAATINYSVT